MIRTAILAGLLLVIPGFITDAVALLLLIPPLRHALRGLLGLVLVGKVETAVYARSRTIDGEFEEIHGTLPSPPPEGSAPKPPGADHPA